MTEDFHQSQAEALKGLLQSLGSTEYKGQKASPELVQKLAERLGEMLGEAESSQSRGEALNENSEPIIDISEPVPEDAEDLTDGKIPEEPALVALDSLTHEERSRRKAEMDSILDALEEEEAQENRVAQEKAAAASQAFLSERRRESEMLQTAAEERKKREKKMGKALLGALGTSPSQSPSPVSHTTNAPAPPVKKKSVKFENQEPSTSELKDSVKKKAGWGDVLAALPSSSSRRLMQNSPMKSDVVERFPAKLSSSSSSPPQSNPRNINQVITDVDSDDEDVVSGGPSDDSTELEEGVIDDDGLDLVDALHQQEIAAEYYARREGIMNSSVLAEAMKASATSENENPWEKEHVPLDATLTHPPPQAGGSRFKASRQRPFAPQSFEGNILPASMLRGAVQMGAIENDELVGAANDSEEELAVDIEEKLAIDSAKQKLLKSRSTEPETHSDSGTPLMNDLRSSPKLHPEEELAAQLVASVSARTVSSPLATNIGGSDPASKSRIPGTVPSPSFSSMIVESPSFTAPSRQGAEYPQPPFVLADTVRESAPRQPPTVQPTNSNSRAPPKLSRFKAARS